MESNCWIFCGDDIRIVEPIRTVKPGRDESLFRAGSESWEVWDAVERVPTTSLEFGGWCFEWGRVRLLLRPLCLRLLRCRRLWACLREGRDGLVSGCRLFRAAARLLWRNGPMGRL